MELKWESVRWRRRRKHLMRRVAADLRDAMPLIGVLLCFWSSALTIEWVESAPRETLVRIAARSLGVAHFMDASALPADRLGLARIEPAASAGLPAVSSDRPVHPQNETEPTVATADSVSSDVLGSTVARATLLHDLD